MFVTLLTWVFLVKNRLWYDYDGTASLGLAFCGAGELTFYIWFLGLLFGKW